MNTNTVAGARAAAVAVLLFGASACGSSPSGSATATATPTATQQAVNGPRPLGATFATSNDDTYTLIAFQTVQAKNNLNTPAPGGAFSAADIKECAGGGQTLTTDPTQWTAEFSGNDQVAGHDASTVATPGPPLPTMATVSSGQCIEGWVVFTHFADGTGRTVSLNGTDISWTLP